MVPLITVIGLSYASLLEGAVLTETVFAWPGLGLYITRSLFNADMNAVLGGTLVVGTVFIGLNLLSDLLYRSSTRGRDERHDRAQPGLAHWLLSDSAAARAGRRGCGNVYRGWLALRAQSRWRWSGLAHRRAADPDGDLRAAACARHRPIAQDLAEPACCRLRPSTGSAPTSSAATSMRASSTARGSR